MSMKFDPENFATVVISAYHDGKHACPVCYAFFINLFTKRLHMPLDLLIRFRCDECGLEYSLVGTANVDQFPFTFTDLVGVKAPPKGWEVSGVVAKCPQHSQRVKLASMPALRAALSKGN